MAAVQTQDKCPICHRPVKRPITMEDLKDHPDDTMVIRVWKQRAREKLEKAEKFYEVVKCIKIQVR